VIAVLYGVRPKQISVLYVTDRISSDEYRTVAPIIGLIVAGGYCIIPFKFYRRQAKLDSLLDLLTEDENNYKTNVKDFFIDYDRANPYTSTKAWEDWQKLVKGHERKPNYVQHAQLAYRSSQEITPLQYFQMPEGVLGAQRISS
jgi:hypothetical protein